MKKKCIILFLIITLLVPNFVIAKNTIANPSPQKVLLNSKQTNLEGYNIEDLNYFKLRDVAAILKDTDKKFNVEYSVAEQKIEIEKDKNYTVLKDDLMPVKDKKENIFLTNYKVYSGEKALDLKGYNIGNYTYYKLRDLAAALNFGVTFNDATNEVSIDTTKEYVPETAAILKKGNWAPNTHKALENMILEFGNKSEKYDEKNKPYAVFDFDNTSVINDVQEALLVYQSENLLFKFKPEEAMAVLETGIPDVNKVFDEEYNKLTVKLLAEDISSDYAFLYKEYKGFNAGGVKTLEEIKLTPEYKDFVAKLRYLYDAVNDTFDASVGYPWVTYLFTGMTPDEVYNLAKDSHKFWSTNPEFKKVKLESPKELPGKAGEISVSYKTGIRITDELTDLYHALMDNGIDVYVCSASFIDVIKAIASDKDFGFNVPAENVYAMRLKIKDGVYINEYDNEYFQTQGEGKTKTIEKFITPKYNGRGPIFVAGDSQGDYNMMVDFKDMRLGLLFNRYRKDDTKKLAQEAVKTLGQESAKYVLQGRDENKGVLIPTEKSILLGTDEEVLVRD